MPGGKKSIFDKNVAQKNNQCVKFETVIVLCLQFANCCIIDSLFSLCRQIFEKIYYGTIANWNIEQKPIFVLLQQKYRVKQRTDLVAPKILSSKASPDITPPIWVSEWHVIIPTFMWWDRRPTSTSNSPNLQNKNKLENKINATTSADWHNHTIRGPDLVPTFPGNNPPCYC